jgi:hypothetical protein
MKLNYPIVKDWAFTGAVNYPFIAPELIPSRLCGKVYGSEKFSDGTNVASSSIQRMFEEQGVIIVETRNSKYIIRENEVSKEYEEKMGNIWQRLIASINS